MFSKCQSDCQFGSNSHVLLDIIVLV